MGWEKEKKSENESERGLLPVLIACTPRASANLAVSTARRVWGLGRVSPKKQLALNRCFTTQSSFEERSTSYLHPFSTAVPTWRQNTWK